MGYSALTISSTTVSGCISCAGLTSVPAENTPTGYVSCTVASTGTSYTDT